MGVLKSVDHSQLANDVDTYLSQQEQQHQDIWPGAEKEVIWHDPINRTPTDLALIYIHGFTATKEEIRDVPDQVAHAFKANLFFTRLTGHGQTPAALGRATVNDWNYDVQEALAVGQQLGKQVVVITTSTGSSLITPTLIDPLAMASVLGVVMLAPNFGIRAPGLELLSGPWGAHLALAIMGTNVNNEASSPEHQRWWTLNYPSSALIPLAQAVDAAVNTPIEQVLKPTLFIFSKQDQVVDSTITQSIIERWPNRPQVVHIENAEDPNHHLIAGRVRSPSTSNDVAQTIIKWIKGLKKAKPSITGS